MRKTPNKGRLRGENNLNPAFDKLNEEKKNKIIKACLEEFSDNGYENASTNSIVSKAGISKGLLFHYFENKRNIYLYLIDISINRFLDKFYEYEAEPSKDIFERLIQSGMIKIRLALEEPQMYKIVMEAFIDTPRGMEEEIQSRYQKIFAQTMPNVFENLDYSKFREDIDKNKAVEFIIIFLDSLYNKYVKMAKGKATKLSNEELDLMIKEQFEFVEMVKYGLYKKE